MVFSCSIQLIETRHPSLNVTGELICCGRIQIGFHTYSEELQGHLALTIKAKCCLLTTFTLNSVVCRNTLTILPLGMPLNHTISYCSAPLTGSHDRLISSWFYLIYLMTSGPHLVSGIVISLGKLLKIDFGSTVAIIFWPGFRLYGDCASIDISTLHIPFGHWGTSNPPTFILKSQCWAILYSAVHLLTLTLIGGILQLKTKAFDFSLHPQWEQA